MNASPQFPRRQDPTLRALVERGLARAQAREIADAAVESPSGRLAPAAKRAVPPLRTLSLSSDRACVETNLARKGLSSLLPGPAPSHRPGQSGAQSLP